MNISESDRQIIVWALDSLGVALADHDHNWTVGERTIYEEAINVLTASSPCRKGLVEIRSTMLTLRNNVGIPRPT